MKKSTFTVLTLFLISALLGTFTFILYFMWFGNCVLDECVSGVLLPYNIPDNQIFYQVITDFSSYSLSEILVRNYGIALPYVALMGVLDEDLNDQIVIISAMINWVVYLLSGFVFAQLCIVLKPKFSTIVWFLLFPPFILFSVLINKDGIMILLVLSVTLAVLKRWWFTLLLLTVAISLIRMQYLLFPVFLLFMLKADFRLRFAIAYVCSAMASALIANFFGVYDIDWSAGGFSSLVYSLNKEYFVGSLLLNPVRVIHYVIAFLQECLYIKTDDGIDYMKLIQGATFVYLLYLLPGYARFLVGTWRIAYYRDFVVLRAAIFSYLLVLLLTPITEPRYFMIGCPLLLLAARISLRDGTPPIADGVNSKVAQTRAFT